MFASVCTTSVRGPRRQWNLQDPALVVLRATISITHNPLVGCRAASGLTKAMATTHLLVGVRRCGHLFLRVSWDSLAPFMEPYAATVIPAWQGCVFVQTEPRMSEDSVKSLKC
jgi:hypothetical protein